MVDVRVVLAFLAVSAIHGCASAPALENIHEIAHGVLTGAVPHGDESFQELSRRGVRTVISVDGAKPDVEAARKHGLRYVHLPIGYDGIPQDRAMELAKALTELPGPFYLHCHHGKHRGPAAAAVACVVAGRIDNSQAVAAMKSMGTGEQYLGLWFSARTAKPADREALRSLKVEYREIAAVPPLAEAMVALDLAFENLELCRSAGWKTPPGHPDLDPPHEALRAREILTEILRTDDFKARPADFRAWLEAGHRAALDLESRLRESRTVDPAFDAFRKSCADCHQAYRNTPRK
jgi:protein tyrosine phosphatase (PTP) superfamily phosphohydrolase (DUF442 family)